MREILFRGKSLNTHEWEYGYFFVTKDDEYMIAELNSENSVYIIPDSLCQFTGLTDKNGTKIFEGDIVLFNVDERGVVYYDNEETSFMMEYGNCIVQMGYCFCSRDLEVIGNIHDNHELIESEVEE